MKISIIIPNYNGADLLRKNLPKVLAVVGDAEIIIVDDASTDGSLRVLDSFKSKIKVIKNKRNLGFSSAVNKAVKEARGEMLILLNTDVVPEKDFLSPLLSHFSDQNVFAVGCMDKSTENGKIILRGRGIGCWKRGFFVHARGEVDKINTLWVSGGSGAFRRSIWEKLGGFDDLYNPFYWEDIDLSYRALKSGYQILFETRSVVLHEHEKGAIKKQYSPFKIKTIAYRNQFIFAWKNLTDPRLMSVHIFWFPYHLLKALLRLDLPFFFGFFQAFILLPKILQSRSRNNFIKGDNQVVEDYKI